MSFEKTVKRILTLAAKLVVQKNEDNAFSCLAITEAGRRVAGGYGGGPEVIAAKLHYLNLFSPHRFGNGQTRNGFGRGRPPFGSATSYWDKEPTPERQQERRDALLLAAASYVDNGDDSIRFAF